MADHKLFVGQFVGHTTKPVRISFGEDGKSYLVGTVPLDEHGRLRPEEVVRFMRDAADHMVKCLEHNEKARDANDHTNVDDDETAEGRHAR